MEWVAAVHAGGHGPVHGDVGGDDLPTGPAHDRWRERCRRSAAEHLGAVLGRASIAVRARAHLRREYLPPRTAHAGVLRNAIGSGRRRGAPVVARRRSRTGLQPAADGRLRAVGRRYGAPGAGSHGTPGGGARRRRHVRVLAVPLRSLLPLPVAAHRVDASGPVGLSPVSPRSSPSLCRGARSGGGRPGADVDVQRAVPRRLPGRRRWCRPAGGLATAAPTARGAARGRGAGAARWHRPWRLRTCARTMLSADARAPR